MKQYLCLAFLVLLFVASYTDAVCIRVENPQELIEYACERGSISDLDQIPNEVEKIRITNMPIGRITESMFSRFGNNLRVLTCSHCQITDIDDRAFFRLKNLEQLSLDNNNLKEVRGAWFNGLVYLTYLDFNYNNIERIDGDVFRNAPDLVDVRISGNRLMCLDVDAMSHLKSLKRIFINENPSFACPNAVRKFLNDHNINFEADPHWETTFQDRINVHVPPMPPVEQENRDRFTTPANYYTRPRYTEPTVTTPPIPETTMPPMVPPTPPRQRPHVPETILPNNDQQFAPMVTQQQLNNYPAQQIQNTTAIPISTVTNATHQAAVISKDATTTECPNSAAGLSRDLALILTTIIFACKWTVNNS